ncbi:MAG: rhodanese-like domain-containing protein [Planctomycetota bacterium]|nr:rhodanese-like domain-containing protein [Planctomycetota bacterium]
MALNNRVRLALFLSAFAVVVAGALVARSRSGAPEWGSIKQAIREKFPEVPQTSTQELAGALSGGATPAPLLFDARTEAEFDVSHLPGARRVTADDLEALAGELDKAQPIVCYCSVGYRSSALAEKLRAAGFTRVSNLEGSIFQWANEGRPLEAGGKPAEKVHPFNATWGALLEPQRRAEVK